MMVLPQPTEFSPPEIAERIGASKRAVQGNLAELASRHYFVRANHGDCGRRLVIKVNHVALVAFACRLGTNRPSNSGALR
jgi:hypothetical protein